MKIIDWRKTNPETQEVIRKQAVLAIVEGGESAEDVIRIMGLTESRLYDWLAKYRKGGFDGGIAVLDLAENRYVSVNTEHRQLKLFEIPSLVFAVPVGNLEGGLFTCGVRVITVEIH